jgi:hypothetical protein
MLSFRKIIRRDHPNGLVAADFLLTIGMYLEPQDGLGVGHRRRAHDRLD